MKKGLSEVRKVDLANFQTFVVPLALDDTSVGTDLLPAWRPR